MKYSSSIALAAVMGIVGTAGGYALGRKSAPEATVRASAVSAPARTFTMPAELAQRAGVQSEPARTIQLAPTLSLVGSVDFDSDRVADVGARIAGRVTRVFVRPGALVRAGDPLVEIESASLSEVIASLNAARAHAAAARNDLARQLALAQQRLTTAREVELARSQSLAIAAEVSGYEQRLRAMGAGSGGQRGITLRAPIAGKVLSRAAVLGQVVDATSNLVRIADLSRLWLQLELFERDLARVREGDAAEIVAESDLSRVFRGTVQHVGATLDATTRTARVRVEFDNAEERLRPGQFVTARLRTSTEGSRAALSIARSSVLQIDGHTTVFVAVAGRENEYEPRVVELGVSDGQRVEVLRGVSEGERVVRAGAFALKSEMQR